MYSLANKSCFSFESAASAACPYTDGSQIAESGHKCIPEGKRKHKGQKQARQEESDRIHAIAVPAAEAQTASGCHMHLAAENKGFIVRCEKLAVAYASCHKT